MIQMTRSAFCAVCAIATAATIATVVPQAAYAQDKPVNLAYNFKAKDSYRSKLQVNTSVNGQDVAVTATAKTEIKEIKPNGDFVVVLTNEGGKLNLGGQEQDQPAQPPVTATRNKYGKLVEYKAEDAAMGILAPEVQKLMAMLGEQLMTDKEVKKGDTWTTEIENPAVPDKKVSVKGTYLGTETIDGVEVWKMKQSADAAVDKDGAKLSIDFTNWINPANGQVVKSEGTVKGLPTQFGPMDWTMKQELIKK
jgi:hypothetical protein